MSDDIGKQKSVERGWVELKSGLGDIVTEDDTFLDALMKEVIDESTM